MRIALDATYAIGEELSGVGLYSREMLDGLAALRPEVRFEYWLRPHRFLRAAGLAARPNTRRRLLAGPLAPRGAALYHGLNQRLPAMRLRNTVVTFHDLFVMTGDYSTPEFRARFTAQARDAARRADVVIAVSEFTKRQVVGLLGVPEARVRVVHHGARSLEFPEVAREPVILHVGALQTRKNIVRLVEAFETLDESWRLVLAGAAGFGAAGILERIASSPARARIELPGYVTPAELAGWYARATVFAFPSLDEGFGMPLLEAMAAGTAILTSNRSALPEVAGDAALLVDPEDTAQLGAALRQLAGDTGLREELARRGKARVQTFTWDTAVRETWDVYRELLGRVSSAGNLPHLA
ncbi:MAG: glycosyltransferase family 1 protein [Bryobacteraceae bacterium]